MNHKKRNILTCYYSLFTNGMMVLVIGAILPYLKEEANVNFSEAGSFLSAFAIGNLMASFIAPFLTSKLGRRIATVLLTSFMPIFLFVITLVPSVPIIYLSFVFVGIGRGTVSIIDNLVVSENDNRASAMNILHTMFAVGAFIAPFLSVIVISSGFSWKFVIYIIIVLLMIGSFNFSKFTDAPKKIRGMEIKSKEKSFLKSVDFYIIGLILFFYLGLENCVNGWFVTYFKESGIMSDSYATNLVSITWLLMMTGRLTNAYISKKFSKQKLILINCVCSIFFFLLLISTDNLVVITVAVVGIGFFFAGIYPTGIANAAEFIKGSTSGISVLLAIAALGGIITPQIVGIAADHIGMSGAIGFLMIGIAFMVLFAIVNLIRHNAREKKAEEMRI